MILAVRPISGACIARVREGTFAGSMELSGTPFSGWIVVAIAASIALILSYAASRIVSRSKLLPDKPNHRSSHARITPRAGGVAIMGGWTAAILLITGFSKDVADKNLLLVLAAFGIVIALFGFLDDRFALSSRIKLGFQASAAICFVVLFGGFETLPLPFVGLVTLGFLGGLVSLLWIIGFMNAFNFMDGADGLAGASAVIVLSAFSVAAAGLGAPTLAIAAMVLVFAIGGFLRVNFPYGKLFMGDSGSQSIGFLIAGFAILGARVEGATLNALFVATAMSPFLFDALFTVAHRLARGQNVLNAHREHLYQLLMRHGYSHVRVTSIYTMLTAVSTAIAIFMMHAPPAVQWTGPLLVAILMTGPAVSIFIQSRRAGFFETEDDNLRSIAQMVRELRARRKERAVKGPPKFDEEDLIGDLELLEESPAVIVPARQSA